MFTFDAFEKLNSFLSGFYRVLWLNILWIAGTLAGLVVLGFGPASYAMAKYLDGWLRLGNTPPITRTFFADMKEAGWRSIAMSGMLLALGVIVFVNVSSSPSGTIRAVNLVIAALVALAGCFVFSVQAVLEVPSIWEQIRAAFLIGVGSLQWVIVGGAVLVGVNWLMWRFASPLCLISGVGLPAFAIALMVRPVFRNLSASTAHAAAHETADLGATEAFQEIDLMEGTYSK